MALRQTKTRKISRLPRYDSTTKGIYSWYTAIFEKLGWMVLAKEKGYGYKIDTYKKSIDNLLKTIKHTYGEYEEHNRQRDLHILFINTECLKDFVNKNL